MEEVNKVVIDDDISELLVEWSNVGDESGGKEDISNNDLEVLSEINNGLTPSLKLTAESTDKSLSQVKLSLASLSLSHRVVFVIHSSLELIHELL